MDRKADAARATTQGARRQRGLSVFGGYLGLAALLALVGVVADAPVALRALILMSEPVSSLIGEGAGAWAAVATGVAVNAAVLGYVVHSVSRFGARMDDMAALAERMLRRRDG